MLVRLASTRGPRSVYDIGLDNVTEADGLAVAQASELVFTLVGRLVAGVYTVADDDLFRVLARLGNAMGIRIEPSAAACFLGSRLLLADPASDDALPGRAARDACATHLYWTTGGSLVPADEYARFLRRGDELLCREAAG